MNKIKLNTNQETRKNSAAPRKNKPEVISIAAPPVNTAAYQLWVRVMSFGKRVQQAIVFGNAGEGIIDEKATRLALLGINRHLNACARADVNTNDFAIQEIILDARRGLAFWQ